MQMLCSGTWRHPQRRSGQVGGEGLGTEKATQTVGPITCQMADYGSCRKQGL